ncbi:MAG: LLM class flavin-dependent oxidoreductase [Chloroflexi bacterium]|nr:LLM class flavin-dependent oxidoreductase [Chloroflexota bacterium]
MQLGIKLTGPATMRREDLVAMIQRAEALGYHSFWVGERWGWDPFVSLAEIAVKTTRIGLGISVTNVFSRTPGATAQAAASVDIISRGRLILGLGSSGLLIVEKFHGVKFERPVQRTREYIEVLQLMFSGHRVDYQGQIVRVSRFGLELPMYRDRIPIYLAALGPRNLRLCGELADGWVPTYVNPATIGKQIALVHEGARAAGRDPKAVTLSPEVYVCVTKDKPAARDLMRRGLARSLSGSGAFYASQAKRAGFEHEVDELLKLWRGGKRDEAPRVVTDEMIDAFSIIGDAEECKARLQQLHASGWDMPIVRFMRGSPQPWITETMEALAT